MEEVKKGVEYKLDNFNSDDQQTIRFTEKNSEGGYNDGTTNEEVINMMIERFYSLNQHSHSRENMVILELLKVIRRYLAKRLDRKIKRLRVEEE